MFYIVQCKSGYNFNDRRMNHEDASQSNPNDPVLSDAEKPPTTTSNNYFVMSHKSIPRSQQSLSINTHFRTSSLSLDLTIIIGVKSDWASVGVCGSRPVSHLHDYPTPFSIGKTIKL